MLDMVGCGLPMLFFKVICCPFLLSRENKEDTMTCYYPDGSVAQDYSYVSCTGESGSSCCIPSEGDVCLSSGLCYYASQKYPYRGACTDKTWNSDKCAKKYCPNINTGGWQGLVKCANNLYCCEQDQSSNACCTQQPELFSIDINAVVGNSSTSYASLQASGASNPSQTSRIPVPSNFAATVTATPSHSSSSSSSSTLAIALGVSLSVVFLLLIAFVAGCILVRRRRNKRASSSFRKGGPGYEVAGQYSPPPGPLASMYPDQQHLQQQVMVEMQAPLPQAPAQNSDFFGGEMPAVEAKGSAEKKNGATPPAEMSATPVQTGAGGGGMWQEPGHKIHV